MSDDTKVSFTELSKQLGELHIEIHEKYKLLSPLERRILRSQFLHFNAQFANFIQCFFNTCEEADGENLLEGWDLNCAEPVVEKLKGMSILLERKFKNAGISN